MKGIRKIGVILLAAAVAVAIFGVWLKSYNDRIAQMQVNETGTCFLSDGTCLHSTSDFIIYSSLGFAAFLAAIGAYLLLPKAEPRKIIVRKTEKQPPPKTESQTAEPKTLSAENKSIFDLVVQANGAILQGELVAKSGMDKVKVSRILDKLEMLGLIERRRHGMSNLVVLKK